MASLLNPQDQYNYQPLSNDVPSNEQEYQQIPYQSNYGGNEDPNNQQYLQQGEFQQPVGYQQQQRPKFKALPPSRRRGKGKASCAIPNYKNYKHKRNVILISIPFLLILLN